MKTRKNISIIILLIMLLMVCSGCGVTDKKDKEKNETETVVEKEEEKEPYIKIIDDYYNGMIKGNLEKHLSVFPEFMEMEKEIDEDYLEDIVEDLEDEYGKKLKFSYEVKKENKIKKEELEYVEKYISIMYDEEAKVSEGYEIKIATTIEGQDDFYITTFEVYIYKINGEWKWFSVSPDEAEDCIRGYED